VRVSEYRVSFLPGRLWRLAALAAAGLVGATSQSDAAIYYWQNSFPGYSQFSPFFPQRRQKARHQPSRKSVVAEKNDAKPQGPVIISISIAEQKLHLYDANGLFAESPVSTGMPGHPTPMGVFSVIQKQKYHRSNIYSGAPMPYMQRITWSGVAMHAGVLPGHPASHGCIRMPMAFAVKMYNWTRSGARVVITPGDITPESFSHPVLATVKAPPQPLAEAAKSEAFAAAKSEQSAEAQTAARAAAEPTSELRSAMMPGAAPEISKTDGVTKSSRPESPIRIAEKSAVTATPAAAPATMTDAAKDLRSADAAKSAALSKADAIGRRSGQIAVFVSRKDSRLYVRQNFSPLFDVAVTIAADERPLGTHIFTAQVDKDDANVLHWSVVSLPAPTVHADRRSERELRFHGRKAASSVPAEVRQGPVPDSAAEALDRLSLPADIMAKIFQSITTGGSIIVSDQGIAAGETGEGTDFIVSLH